MAGTERPPKPGDRDPGLLNSVWGTPLGIGMGKPLVIRDATFGAPMDQPGATFADIGKATVHGRADRSTAGYGKDVNLPAAGAPRTGAVAKKSAKPRAFSGRR